MRVIVIGAGAAGLVAAAEAARRGARVVLIEKNGKTGVKILMSGGTRCNLTHDTDARGITAAFGRGGRFLQPSVGAFPPADVVQMFTALGVSTKVESTGKIFPKSDRALDVRDALHRNAVAAGVEVRLRCPAVAIGRDASGWHVQTPDHAFEADHLIVTSGGKSWPGCGTTGDAYRWLQDVGHTIIRPRPALVPLVGGFDWTRQLSGVAMDDCQAIVVPATGKRKPLIQRRGSLLLTHFGFSGPLAMDVSGAMTAATSFDEVRLNIDLLPDIDEHTIQQRLSDRSGGEGRGKVSALLNRWFPKRLSEALALEAGFDGLLAELPRTSSRRLVELTKRLDLGVTGTRGFEKAEVTAGGVSLKEVDPRTMASRLVPGLFIAGEVLDLDGWIGGYNFQAAFSTGRAAGIAASHAASGKEAGNH